MLPFISYVVQRLTSTLLVSVPMVCDTKHMEKTCVIKLPDQQLTGTLITIVS